MEFRKGMTVGITGGSIDFDHSTFEEIATGEVDRLVPREHSIVPEFLEGKVKIPRENLDFFISCLKDSRDLTGEDRARLYEQIKKSPHGIVLITHGIADMRTTAMYLKEQRDIADRVIGVVGSRVPLESYRSDAGFHMGYAIGQMQGSDPGIYTFHPNENKEGIKKILEDTVIRMTGGTIDSQYDESADTARPYFHSRIPDYFDKKLGVKIPEPSFVFREVCMKDSRELSEEEIRQVIVDAKNSPHKNQIVTAGTYATPDIANRFQHMVEREELPDSKYLFISAMTPENVRLCDGWFNLGYGLGKMEKLANGVYVCMHSWTTHPGNVMKQLAYAKFGLYDQDLVF